MGRKYIKQSKIRSKQVEAYLQKYL